MLSIVSKQEIDPTLGATGFDFKCVTHAVPAAILKLNRAAFRLVPNVGGLLVVIDLNPDASGMLYWSSSGR